MEENQISPDDIEDIDVLSKQILNEILKITDDNEPVIIVSSIMSSLCALLVGSCQDVQEALRMRKSLTNIYDKTLQLYCKNEIL
jgi:hypothetical protein